MAPRTLPAIGALAVTLALTLSGCAFTSQVTTGKAYAASDGIGATVDGVVAQNLLLITAGADDNAVLVGALYNSTEVPVSVDVAVEQGMATVTIPAMSTATLGLDEADTELVTTTTIAPGHTSQVTITVNDGASTTKPLPVLDGTLPEYDGVLKELQAAHS